MNQLLTVFMGTIERGLIFALTVLGVFIASRVLKFDDLSLEGSFLIGAAMSALLVLKGVPVGLVLLAAAVAGGLVGLTTALVHIKCGMNNLISGIVVTTGLFSVVLAGAGAQISLSHYTAFTLFDGAGAYKWLVVGLMIVASWFGAYWWLSQSQIGLLMRATGANPHLVGLLGKNVALYKIGTLMLANALNGFAGALYVLYVGYFSIWMNVGVLVAALTGLMLAELLPHIGLITLVLGSLMYQMVLMATYECDIDPQWSKLITALLIVVIMASKQLGIKND